MTTAYLITTGCYSEYSVECVFLDATLAHEFVDKMNARPDGTSTTEYEVLEMEVGAGPVDVHYVANGSVRDGERGRIQVASTTGGPSQSHAHWHYMEYRDEIVCFLELTADTPARAEKAMSEKIAQTVADWDILVYAARERGDLPPAPEYGHPNMVAPGWFCKECGSGPFNCERVQSDGLRVDEHWELHAPSCSLLTEGTDRVRLLWH